MWGETVYSYEPRWQDVETEPWDISFKRKTICLYDKANEVEHKTDRNLSGCMVLGAQISQLTLRNVLTLPLRPLFWTLTSGNRSFQKNKKLALARVLGKYTPWAETIWDQSADIADEMNLVHKIKGNRNRFQLPVEYTVLHFTRVDILFVLTRKC